MRGRSKLPAISLVAGLLVTCFEMPLSPIREEGENGGAYELGSLTEATEQILLLN